MPLARRRPLLRAAAVGGGAYIAGKRSAQAGAREATQEDRLTTLEAQQSAPPGPAASAQAPAAGGLSSQDIERLQQLGELRSQGVLSEDEFEQQKQRLLAGG
ncbi:MAG TPA: SHOCT domain-containing protein [Solirubrobacteraceae bacterium]|jgi:hypothetical protein|nr:SHOCT domain-containing protein [Solirubrobacteraceae bacterium]